MWRRSVCSMLLLAMAACSSSPFKRTGKLYPPYTGELIVYTKIPEGTAFEELGTVRSRYNPSRDWAEIIKNTKRQAAQNGANAIIIDKKAKDSDFYVLPSGDMLIPFYIDYKYIRAAAIRICR